MSKKLHIVGALMLVAGLMSCNKQAQVPYNKETHTDSTAQEVARLNVMLQEQEDSILRVKASKMGLEATPYATYLRVAHTGKGDTIVSGQMVRLDYTLTDLDGNVLYAHSAQDAVSFKVGKDRKQQGLSHALQRMRDGDSAVVLVPSVMAFGALGDGKKVMPRASLIYHIHKVVVIEKQKP